MNDAHFHLVVNHLPIIFPLVGIIVMLAGLFSNSEAVRRTAYLIFSMGALTTIAAMTSGEGAEDVVEKLNGVSENYIERHEEAAEMFAILSYILGGLSLLALWVSFKFKSFSNLLSAGTLLLALALMFAGKQTGTTGGEIRHTEIRSGVSVPAPDRNNTEHENDD